MSIWVHSLVQNEERYLWFSITSVIDYVDKILLWDTGSTDDTLKIVNELKKLYKEKIDFKKLGEVDKDQFTEVRKEMLKKTNADWLMLLDGDEVWWDVAIAELSGVIKKTGKNYDSIVSSYVNLVGDIFHYQDEDAGQYEIKGRKGFLTIRAMNINNIKGLNVEKPHGQQGFYDANGNLIQERKEEKMYFQERYAFLHFTNLQRSADRASDLKVPKRGFKLKYEIGNSFPRDFLYPEVFFRKRPEFVRDPWSNMDAKFFKKALLQTPLRRIKRRIFKSMSGY